MKKSLSVLSLLLVSAVVAFAQPLSDEQIKADLREHNWYSAGGYSPYLAPEFEDTPAPAGYKAFYVSHLGRHGSRYQSSTGKFVSALAILDSLHKKACLTASGESLRMELQYILDAHKGMTGMLTDKGTREHTMIARNLVRRCPELFSQKDRKVANFRSTLYPRTVQSMSGFEAGILGSAPGLDVNLSSGFKAEPFKKDSYHFVGNKEMGPMIDEVMSGLHSKEDEFGHFCSTVFKGDVKAALGVGDLYLCVWKIFSAASCAYCLDIEVDPLRFFNVDELLALYKVNDARFSVLYGPLSVSRDSRIQRGQYWGRLFVDQADAALEAEKVCADFRFAHDGDVGPLMMLLGIGPYQYVSEPSAPYRNWQSYRYICMGSNLQMLFYRNKTGNVLVKALYNEKEVDFPGLDPVNGVYYKWADVRRYIVSRTDGLREVPGHYTEYIKEKAGQIAKLQQDEADGFFFLSDVHYPANFGNTPALIEYLESNAGKRPVIFGGDIVTYVDYMDHPIALHVSALEQLRGCAKTYWVRGNHDCVNYTGRKPWITQDRYAFPQWTSAELMARYTSSDVVRNQEDPISSYYYFDNPAGRIRYIAIESTDSVSDNRVIYGMSDRQLKWIAGEAILKAPKGFRIVIFSHVPPVDKKNTRMVDIIDAVKQHSSVKIGDETFDFSSRKDLVPLVMVCGHRHEDYVKTTPGGVRQINVNADCNYSRLDKAGTVEEQSFEYFSISKDFTTVRTVKIGAGESRVVTLY